MLIQTAGALLAPSPAGGWVLVPFVAYCGEIFLAFVFGVAYVVDLAAPATANRTVLAASLWGFWLAMAGAVYFYLPQLTALLGRYEYGSPLGTISAAPGMSVAQIERDSTLKPVATYSQAHHHFAAPAGRIFVFAIAGTPTSFDHASLFETTSSAGTIQAIHAAIVPSPSAAGESEAALDRAKLLLRSEGWGSVTDPNLFRRASLRLKLVRRIVGHASIADPNSPAEYSVFAELSSS